MNVMFIREIGNLIIEIDIRGQLVNLSLVIYLSTFWYLLLKIYLVIVTYKFIHDLVLGRQSSDTNPFTIVFLPPTSLYLQQALFNKPWNYGLKYYYW